MLGKHKSLSILHNGFRGYREGLQFSALCHEGFVLGSFRIADHSTSGVDKQIMQFIWEHKTLANFCAAIFGRLRVLW